jgi:Major Facilitator Superfamily
VTAATPSGPRSEAPAAPGGPGDERPAASESWASAGTILGFSFALGTGTLALPLLALAAGYDAAAIGLLTAVSAVSQFGLRLQLPWLLGRYPDRALIGLSCLMIASSYGLLLVSEVLPAFLVAQLLQGGARALFWTSSQTHAVRGAGTTVRSLARVQVIGNIGTLSGPAAAGVAAGVSLELALAIGLISGVAGATLSRAMRYLPPFERHSRPGERRIWQRPGVDLACWAGFTAGGWRAMLGSYVPVILTAAGLGPSIVGALLALADGAAIAAGLWLVRHTPARAREAIEIGVVVSCVGLGVLPLVAGQAAVVAGIIALGGIGSGILTTIGPALASDSVAPNERGDAIAVAGTFRAAALLATPAGVAAGLAFVTLPVGMVVAAIGLAIPAVASGLRARRLAPAGGPA